MKAQTFNLVRYDSDDGFVFDWAEPRYREEIDENGELIRTREHLYVKTLYIGPTDNIANYVEVAEDATDKPDA